MVNLITRTLNNKEMYISFIFTTELGIEEVFLSPFTQCDLNISIGFLRPNSGVKGVSGKIRIYNNFQSDRGINMVEKLENSIRDKRICYLKVKIGYHSVDEFLEFKFQIFRIQFNKDLSDNTPSYSVEFVTLDNFDKIFRSSSSLNKTFTTNNTYEDILLYILNAPFILSKQTLPYKTLQDIETLGVFKDDLTLSFLKTKLTKKYNLIFDNTSAYSKAYSQALETFYQEFNRILPEGYILVNQIISKGVLEKVIKKDDEPTTKVVAFIEDSNIIGDLSVSSNPYFEFTTIFDPLYIIADAIKVRSQYLGIYTFSSEANYKLLEVTQYLIDKHNKAEYNIENDKTKLKFLLSCEIDFSTKVGSGTPTMVMRLTEEVPKINPLKTKEKL